LADDGEILVRGPNVFRGYWHDDAATSAALSSDGWYRTGDIGRFDADGRLILMGRNKDIIVLPNGFNVYPEDIENALRVAGIRDSVVVETRPGRIEAIVLAPDSHGLPQGGDIPAAGPAASGDPALVRDRIDASIKAANQTLAVHQRVAGWRLWPDVDFPRTHTLKVKRDLVRGWAAVEEPLPVRQGS
jgi:long-chain acyl-CoA synthetase